MAVKNDTTASVAPKEITIKRIFDAPREMVFDAFTQPEQIAKWFGPRIFTSTASGEAREGGSYRITMTGKDDVPAEYKGPFPMKGEYLEFNRPEKFVRTVDLSEHNDDWKNIIKNNVENYNGQNFLRGTLEMTFTEISKTRTEMSMRNMFDSDEVRDAYLKTGMNEGWSESFDKLDELLTRRIVISRSVNAPRELVFEVWTNPKHLAKWWGPPGMPISVEKFNLKPDGMFLYSSEMMGQKVWGRFIYGEIVKPESLEYVFSFSNERGELVRAPFSGTFPKEIFNAIDFTDDGGKTEVTITGYPVNATAEETEFYLQMSANIQAGFAGTFKQLEEYISTLQ
jgi:uncharacterized protein YndB with AHSA1/START domain